MKRRVRGKTGRLFPQQKNIWPTDETLQVVPRHPLRVLWQTEESVCVRLHRRADAGLTGLWGRRCLVNDYYHGNLRLVW